jgi:hypothetical protein
MAITNAQQFKQLVNPPMDGKRPGYRGDDAYGGGDSVAGGGDQGFGGDGPPGPDDRSTAQQTANQRAQVRAGNVRAIESLINRPNVLKRGLDLYSKYSPIGLITRGITSIADKFGTKRGVSTQGDPYGNMPGMLRGPDPVSFDDDDNTDNGNGQQIILPPMMAQAPSIMDQEPKEEEPFEFYRRFRADGGIMNTDVVGGEMDFESARQMYGLGKLVKKVTRSVKKIAKSPIGKAALLYTVGGGLGSLAKGQGFFSSFMSPMNQITGMGSIFSKSGLQNIASKVGLGAFENVGGNRIFQKNVLGKALTSPTGLIAGASLVSGLLTKEQEEEAQQIADNTGIDIAEIRANPNKYLARRFRAEGGIMRTNYANGSEDAKEEEAPDLSNDPNYKGWVKVYEASPEAAEMNENHSKYLQFYNRKAEGGSMKEPVAKKTMPLLDMGGQEMDLRAEGGFVPIGRMEKADDVPARLSKNEFVFTADAVRNAGEGDVDKGAEVMYNMMKNLESGGEVSEESQGLDGARKMFQTSQRLEEVL